MSAGIADPFGVLRQFVGKKRAAERCELCGADLFSVHPHLLDPKARKLVCACQACAILFSSQGTVKYKRVPDRVQFLSGFRLTDAHWNSLMIPINMAFLFESSPDERVIAMYPSPAGATESQLPLEVWSDVVADNPILRQMQPDVEALLVNRLGAIRGFADAEYYILPIDECYRLVGLIRARWRGLSGGTEMWEELQQFFAGLRVRAGVGREASHA